MSTVVILESLGISDELLKEKEAPFIAAGHVFRHYERTGDTEKLKEEISGADAVILANMPFRDDVISSSDTLKYIDVGFTGVDHIGLKACETKGIHVSNASGYATEGVAELAVADALNFSRDLLQADQKTREGKDKKGLRASELKGKTVGIVGLGKIGTRTAELFHAFGCTILSHSRHVHADAPAYIRQTSLAEVLQDSDYVILTCPLTEETRHMISREQFALMKGSAVLINTARGAVVDSEALCDAVEQGTIAGAVLDVFDQEPPLSPEERILHEKNIIVTPHIGFFTEEAMKIRAEIIFTNLDQWMKGTIANQVL
jgi:D-3-phosphoglycerate dehydrogenase